MGKSHRLDRAESCLCDFSKFSAAILLNSSIDNTGCIAVTEMPNKELVNAYSHDVKDSQLIHLR